MRELDLYEMEYISGGGGKKEIAKRVGKALLAGAMVVWGVVDELLSD